MTTFAELGLAEPLLRALDAEGYTTPTPIQAQAIPLLLTGGDVLGIAQTGTGKTAAFALPLIHRMAADRHPPVAKGCRVLVLTPTRELATQVADSFATYSRFEKMKRAVIFGGVGQNPQVHALARGVDVLVATPGRLLDLMNQGHVRLDHTEALVLDEADRMFAMGFIQDVRKIVAQLPRRRQTVLFSATMPEQIAVLAGSILTEPKKVEVTPPSSTVERIDQSVLFVPRADKRDLLLHLLQKGDIGRALVFTRTKHAANRLAEALDKAGIRAAAIHGNKSQGARQKALADFRDGRLRALVATDIAARGIDVEGLTHVINFDLPNEPESYVHRIGRTARAGADGIALSLVELEDASYLRDIEKTIRCKVPQVDDHPFHCAETQRLHGDPRARLPRPVIGRPAGGGPRGARPQGAAGRPQGAARPHGAGRPQGDRPHGDRVQGDRPHGDRPQGDRPARFEGDRPAKRAEGARPEGKRTEGKRPDGAKWGSGGKWAGKPGGRGGERQGDGARAGGRSSGRGQGQGGQGGRRSA